MLGCMGGGVQGGGIISRSWESPRRCPGAAQLPHASSLVPTHLLGDRRGARAAVSAPPPMGNGSAPSTLCQQVPEWTKCTSREKRKEKVEKPFYSDSEGESGPTESADSGEDPVAWQGMGQGLLWWGIGQGPLWQGHQAGATTVGHFGGHCSGDIPSRWQRGRGIRGRSGGKQGCGGGCGDAAGCSGRMGGCGGTHQGAVGMWRVGLSRAPCRA